MIPNVFDALSSPVDFSKTIWNNSYSNIVGYTMAIPSADNGAHIQEIMANNGQILSDEGTQIACADFDNLATQGDVSISADLRDQDDQSVDKRKDMDAPHGAPKSRRSRRGKIQCAKGVNRVQKKRASASTGEAYTFLRLGRARQLAGGSIECEVYWAPTWVPLHHLEGNDALQEAKDLVVDLFGSGAWQKEARKL